MARRVWLDLVGLLPPVDEVRRDAASKLKNQLKEVINYDDRSIAPLPLKGPLLKKYYAAYRRLAQLLSEPERLVIHPLQPGDLALFDNNRILHGYSAFSLDTRLQVCYVDADGLYSSLALLSRQSS